MIKPIAPVTTRGLSLSLIGFIGLLGIVVIIGWLTRSIALIQILPQFVPMQFNTALGFIASAAAITSIGHWNKVQWPAMLSGTLLVILGAITLSQYLFDWNSGLDELFMMHDIVVATSHPGRMAPNTALCFLLIGLAALSAAVLHNRPLSLLNKHFLFVFGGLVLMLGTVALVGYIANVPTGYGWGNLTRMALHTSVGFVISGCALLLSGARIAHRAHQGLNTAIMIILVTFALGEMLFAHQLALSTQTDKHLMLLRKDLQRIAGEVDSASHELQHALSRLAERLQRHRNQDSFAHDADTYFEDFKHLYAIAVLNHQTQQTDFSRMRKELSSHLYAKVFNRLQDAFKQEHLTSRADLSRQSPNTNTQWHGLDIIPVQLAPELTLFAVVDYGGMLKALPSVSAFSALHGGDVTLNAQHDDTLNANTLSDTLISVAALSHVGALELRTRIDNRHLRYLDRDAVVAVSLNTLLMGAFLWMYRTHRRNRGLSNFLSTVQNTTDTGLIGVSEQGRITHANHAVSSIFGWAADELSGQSIERLIPGTLHGKHRQWVADFIVSGKSRTMGRGRAVEGVHKDGRRIPLDISLNSVISIEGTAVLASIVDVSERVTLQRKLALEKQHLQNIMDSVENGIWGLDTNGLTTFVNNATCRMLGYQAEELIGVPMHAKVHHSFPDGNAYPRELCPMYTAFRDGEVHEVDNEVLWRKDGSCFPIHYISSPIRYKEEINGAVVVFHDVSKQKQLEELQRRHTEKLEHINRELEEFNYVASHDLQEPLRTIASFTNFLHKDVKAGKPEVVSRDIDFIQQAVKRMSMLINDLLSLSRTSRAAFSQEPVDINQCLDNIQHDLHELIHTTNTRLDVETFPQITGDGMQLQRALQNIIQNAIKYRGDNPPLIRIYLESEDHNSITLAVKDNGIGIEPQYHEQIFLPFKRLHSMNEFEGSGIGLAIVKKIIDRHQGKISVHSEHGNGSTFYIQLPRSKAVETPQQKSA